MKWDKDIIIFHAQAGTFCVLALILGWQIGNTIIWFFSGLVDMIKQSS